MTGIEPARVLSKAKAHRSHPSTALLLWFGQQGYTWARERAYDHADAEDIRQEMILALLTQRDHFLNLRFSFLHACAIVTRKFPGVPPSPHSPTSRWEAQLDATRLWRQLGKGDQACLQHWLATDEAPDIPTPTEKRRWHQRLRVLAKLRDLLILPKEA